MFPGKIKATFKQYRVPTGKEFWPSYSTEYLSNILHVLNEHDRPGEQLSDVNLFQDSRV